MPNYQEKMDELARTQGGYFYPWRSVIASGDGESAYTAMVRAALDTDLVVVEAGCGHGPDIPLFAARVHRYIAYDYSPGLIDIAREQVRALSLHNTEIHLVDSDADRGGQIPAADASADLIVSRRGPTNFIRDARRVLKKGGRMIQLNPMDWIPDWNRDLPTRLRITADTGDIEAKIRGLLESDGFAFETARVFDVGEYLPTAKDLWKYASFLRDDAPPWERVRGALEEVYAHYAGRQGLELRHRRFLWSARND
jgi:SAM-dependent methyltransferase